MRSHYEMVRVEVERKTIMANQEHVRLVKQGTSAIEAWRAQAGARAVPFDLCGADLRGISLESANLSEADLRGSTLSGANLHSADLRGANLGPLPLERELDDIFAENYPEKPTNLIGAKLGQATLAGADLVRADLRLADLEQADLQGVDLTGANLRAVKLVGAIYDGTTIWPEGFRPGLSVVKKLVVAFDTDTSETGITSSTASAGQTSFSKAHLEQQKSELQHKYDTVSKRIAALDIDIGRELSSLSRQVLEEQRKEFASQREEFAAQMALIEEQLG